MDHNRYIGLEVITMINKNMKKKTGTGCALIMVAAMVLSGCKGGSSLPGSSISGGSVASTTSATTESGVSASVDISGLSATIELTDGISTYVGNGVDLEGKDVVITAGGTYSFSGTLTDGRIKVEAKDEEVIIILNGVQIANSEGDAIYIEKAENTVVYVNEGTENVLISGAVGSNAASGEDNAENDEDLNNSQKAVIMAKCDLTVTGSGSLTVSGYINNGIQSKDTLTLDSVDLTVEAVNDAIHGNDEVVINDGSFNIKAGDDGIHSDRLLTINGGTVSIDECYEGLEGAVITINDGEVSIKSGDDGINASSDSMDPGIIINGGKVYVDASGDGIDSNKDITINGGEVYVDGPGNDKNAAIDVGSENQGVFAITGGTVTSLGMSGMLKSPDESSTQQSITYVFEKTLEGGSVITITDSEGKEIATITTLRSADSIIYSSKELESGKTYRISSGELTGTITL